MLLTAFLELRSGKDTFVDFCLKEIRGFGQKVSTVDFVKDIAKRSGWNGEKTPKNRKFLSDLKDLLTEWDDVPYKKVAKQIDIFNFELSTFDLSKMGIIFVMCREPQEIQKFVDRLGALTLCVRRATAENSETSNHADADIFNFKYDYYIDNNGTLEELEQKAKEFLTLIQN